MVSLGICSVWEWLQATQGVSLFDGGTDMANAILRIAGELYQFLLKL